MTGTEWSSKASDANINASSIRPPPCGNRIVVELFWNVAPMACENFSKLCCHCYSPFCSDSTNNKCSKIPPIPIGECGKPLTYRGSTIHRVVPGFVMQGGDFVFGNGTGGESVFGGSKKCFKDERAGLLLKHDRRGVLSMGNSGKNSNTSQFFITFGPVPQCDTKHVVFGRITSGFDVLRAVELTGNSSKGADECPSVPVLVTECGVYEPLLTPAAGYWFDQPDADSYLGSTPVFMCRPRIALVVPAVAVSTKFKQIFGSCVTCVATIVVSSNVQATAVGNLTADWEQQEGNEVVVVNQLEKMLGNFLVDVVVAAPACAECVSSISVPPLWKALLGSITGTIDITKKDIVMIAKPSDSLSAVRNSWLSKVGWNLDSAMK